MTRYRVCGLSFNYEGKKVLDNIDFELKEGELLGILGPNGCGKSTLVKNMNRYLSPHDGLILLDEASLEDYRRKDIAKIVSVVPQTNEIRFAFTVRDIVSMGRMPFTNQFGSETSDDEEIIENAMRKAGVKQFENRLINTMSGGERQKVIIARALAQTPRIILMDEPTLHLDVSAQFEILDLIQNLSKTEGLTVVIVSHDLSMVARYCDRIAMIHEHRIMCCGTPEEVLTPENMLTVFNVDAELGMDQKIGKRTVYLHGVSHPSAEK
ncbi:MAG: ABC transporter ATP-binding protein [Candidatus Methanomethylophilaceae archaeon]